ncbi:hypothetical protein [Sphingobium sp. EM0848]|uniref:hypothetical protein n=1 Tax=Sphingobium sp. EM0848 TaxID=2743473 RepID=UPI00210086C9|nr:hypothetical protein [Sphingobium sp. EM0848]
MSQAITEDRDHVFELIGGRAAGVQQHQRSTASRFEIVNALIRQLDEMAGGNHAKALSMACLGAARLNGDMSHKHVN